MDHPADLEVILDGQVLENAAAFRADGQAPANPLSSRQQPDVLIIHDDAAFQQGYVPGDAHQQG